MQCSTSDAATEDCAKCPECPAQLQGSSPVPASDCPGVEALMANSLAPHRAEALRMLLHGDFELATTGLVTGAFVLGMLSSTYCRRRDARVVALETKMGNGEGFDGAERASKRNIGASSKKADNKLTSNRKSGASQMADSSRQSMGSCDASPKDPSAPIAMNAEERKARLKDVRKEGGDKAVTISGASQMGGLQFFCESVDAPRGDPELLLESLKAMNEPKKKITRAHQDPLGGGAHIGKFICSASANQVATVAHVPADLQEKLHFTEWMREVMDWYGGNIVQTSDAFCVGVISGCDNGPKLLDYVKHKATDVLQRKALMPADHYHDGDDELWGDDNHPGLSEQQMQVVFRKRMTILDNILEKEELSPDDRSKIVEKRKSIAAKRTLAY